MAYCSDFPVHGSMISSLSSFKLCIARITHTMWFVWCWSQGCPQCLLGTASMAMYQPTIIAVVPLSGEAKCLPATRAN
uniref:Uncharacterized protein n=1 Tax=Rhizophora mucronata TaxID=61149 RepID=A0A2P2IHD8_RHIMU